MIDIPNTDGAEPWPLDVDDHMADDFELTDLPVMKRSVLRRAAWLGVVRSALMAAVILGVLGAAWTRLGAPAIAERHGRADLIEHQIRGGLQSFFPSSVVADPRTSVSADGSLHFQFFVDLPALGGERVQSVFEFDVSLTGQIGVDPSRWSLAVNDSETLRYSRATPLESDRIVDAVTQLPKGAVVSFAVNVPTGLDDADAQAMWAKLAEIGVEPSGYLLRPDAFGIRRGWSGPELDGFRAWEVAMKQDDGLAPGTQVFAEVGPSTQRAPDAAVTGFVFNAVQPQLVAAAIDTTEATEAFEGPVGLSLALSD